MRWDTGTPIFLSVKSNKLLVMDVSIFFFLLLTGEVSRCVL